MPRVKGTVWATCTFDGCNERGFTEYDGAADRTKAEQWRLRWRCVRHSKDGEDVLTPDRRTLSTVLVNAEESYGLFWRPEGADIGGSGFTFGPGFKVFSKDWPAGTRLRVTAEIVED
jgi:hypothetical protein